MSDFIKELPSQTRLNPTDITKVPALIHFKKEGGFLFFNMLFEGLDVLAAHLLKTDEWFFGIYHGCTFTGYLHFGEIPKEDHQKICDDLLPKDRNVLQQYVDINHGRIEYHTSAPEAWRFIGELDNRKVIQKTM